MVIERFHFFYLFTNWVFRGRVLGHILVSYGALGVTFSGFGGSWKQVGIFMYFGIPPWSPKAKETEKVRVKNLIQIPRRHTKSRLPITCADILRLLVQMT